MLRDGNRCGILVSVVIEQGGARNSTWLIEGFWMMLETITEGRFVGTSGRQGPSYQDHTEAKLKDSRVSCEKEGKEDPECKTKGEQTLKTNVDFHGLRGSATTSGAKRE